MDEIINKARVLIEALPYIQNFYEKVVVIKYGGAAMTDVSIRKNVLEDIVFMSYVGMHPILVHGGGPFVNKRIEELGKKSTFVQGYRVTDEETMKIAEEEFIKVNRDIVAEIKALGGSAMTLSGSDDVVVEVEKHAAINGQDLGYVGEIQRVNAGVIEKMIVGDIIPVIPPLGIGPDDHAYNINADQVAAKIASVLGALKLVLLTNVNGILKDVNDPSSRIPHVALKEVEGLIQNGTVTGGMLPKVNACIEALEGGVKKAHIIDVKIPHALLLEIFTDKGIGTEIVKNGV